MPSFRLGISQPKRTSIRLFIKWSASQIVKLSNTDGERQKFTFYSQFSAVFPLLSSISFFQLLFFFSNFFSSEINFCANITHFLASLIRQFLPPFPFHFRLRIYVFYIRFSSTEYIKIYSTIKNKIKVGRVGKKRGKWILMLFSGSKFCNQRPKFFTHRLLYRGNLFLRRWNR